MRPLSVGVVVPTLNEEASLGRCLDNVLREADRVVVADGGSRDGTLAEAARRGVPVVTAPPGRGSQLNAGAGALDTDILLFVHADTTLPRGAGNALREAVRGGAAGGGFEVRFDDRRPILAFGARLINARTHWLRVPLGDQAQFVRRADFEALGGFHEWPILEDLDFIRRLDRHAGVVILPHTVTTAARRFVQRGVVRTVATNWLIWSLYLVGVSPQRLASLYRHVR